MVKVWRWIRVGYVRYRKDGVRREGGSKGRCGVVGRDRRLCYVSKTDVV